MGTSFVENEILKPKDRGEGDKGDGNIEEKTPQEDTSEEEGLNEEKTEDIAEENPRMPSVAGWEVTSGASDEDTRGWEGRERRVMIAAVGLTREPDAMAISRTHSMSSKTPADSHLLPVHRSGSEPATSHSEVKGKDLKFRMDDVSRTLS
jgi:hypothetical protein